MATIGPMNVAALIVNAQPKPDVASRSVARSGPTSCAIMNWSVLRPTASRSCARGTSAGSIADDEGFAIVHDVYGLRESDARGIDVEHLLRTAVLPEFEAATGIYVRLHVDRRWPRPTPPGLAQAIVRIVQEALNNVRWHSRARAVSVALSVRGELRVMVADDGVGFRMPAAEPAGFGLLGMHERALLAGGSSSISRRRPRGTVVRARFPMPS